MTNELAELCETVHTAGNAVLRILQDGFATSHKANRDPVTTADIEANRVLQERLIGHGSDDGWLSEETQDQSNRLTKERVWIVDPIDGTEEFVKGLPEFAVSVALVQNGLPIMAVIYNPATDEMFYAARGHGAYLNGKAINTTRSSGEKLTILASRSQFRKGKFKTFEPFAYIKPVGSIAYKLALVAAGKANATFSLEPKNEWDIAAGVLLVEESGGTVTDKEGVPFTFNRVQTLVDGIIAASSGTYRRVKSLIVEHAV